MPSYNRIEIIGNLGKDPEMRYTPNGKPVATFSVAVNKTVTGKDGQPEKVTDWFNVKVWDKLAETCNQYLSKGKSVFVVGTLHINNYEKDGQKRLFVEINADRVIFLSPMGEQDETTAARPATATEPTGDISPDDIPFEN
jgi:single-strand DNA-binding protein